MGLNSTQEIRRRHTFGYDFIADAEDDIAILLDRVEFLESEIASLEAALVEA